MDKFIEIEKLYIEAHEFCKSLPGFDSIQVPRKVLNPSLDSNLFIIGQAPGEKTQRVSGIPYTFPNGNLSVTGIKLDKHLSSAGYTLLSDNEKKLVYSSDIAQYYPGKVNGRDRKPSMEQIKNFSLFLNREISIINPSTLLLLGSVCANSFFNIFRNEEVENFSSLLDQEFISFINGKNYFTFVLPHPASSYVGYSGFYDRVMAKIKKI
jgi:uracil-DNA glycosylase family 4